MPRPMSATETASESRPAPPATRERPVRVLFFMVNFAGYFRNFEPALRGLLERGYEVHIALEHKDRVGGTAWAEALRHEHPGLSWSATPGLKLDEFYSLMRTVRLARDYLQVLRPEFGAAPELVRRARRRTPDFVARLSELPVLRTQAGLRWMGRLAEAVEQAIPTSARIDRYIAQHDPDVVLLTPNLMPGSVQSWTITSAQALGLPTAVCVASWDNLSSKQLLRVRPDVVTVWNETQKREAIELHGVPEDRIAVTGAQVYDPWFDWRPRPRDAFCERIGLPHDRPFVLYVAGALFPAAITEPEWVAAWLQALRSSADPVLRDLSVVIRPHPKRTHEWEAIDLEAWENVLLWPRQGEMPVAKDARADFFDSIFHSAGVVGINTSAMIEAGIVGRRVHTVLVPEFTGSQRGTFHFHYLTDVAGGLLQVANDMEELVAQLRESIAAGGGTQEDNREFLEAFVRPHGLDRPAAEVFAEVVAGLVARGRGPASPPPPIAIRALRTGLKVLSHQIEIAAALGRARPRQPVGSRRSERAWVLLNPFAAVSIARELQRATEVKRRRLVKRRELELQLSSDDAEVRRAAAALHRSPKSRAKAARKSGARRMPDAGRVARAALHRAKNPSGLPADVARYARVRTDRQRGTYACVRRVAAPRTTVTRVAAARSVAKAPGFDIPSHQGYRVFGPDRFAGTGAVVMTHGAALERQPPDEPSGKPFLRPMLDGGALTRDSPLMRFALDEEILAAVTRYLGVTPVLASVEVYHSQSNPEAGQEGSNRLRKSQLLHCDGDDTRQVKAFVFCTDVEMANGPLVILDAERSRLVRRRTRYEYRQRLTDETVRGIVGESALDPVVGPAGTVCFVDTSRCFHYGSRVAVGAAPRLAAVVQYLTPFSFLLPRDVRAAAPYRTLARADDSALVRFALGG